MNRLKSKKRMPKCNMCGRDGTYHYHYPIVQKTLYRCREHVGQNINCTAKMLGGKKRKEK